MRDTLRQHKLVHAIECYSGVSSPVWWEFKVRDLHGVLLAMIERDPEAMKLHDRLLRPEE